MSLAVEVFANHIYFHGGHLCRTWNITFILLLYLYHQEVEGMVVGDRPTAVSATQLTISQVTC